MKKTAQKKQTRAEEAYVPDMAQVSALEKVDRGQTRIFIADELPEPLKRFGARERLAVHIRLPVATLRRVASLSQSKGISAEKLARKWVEQGLAREAG